jgi:hypothetical protein
MECGEKIDSGIGFERALGNAGLIFQPGSFAPPGLHRLRRRQENCKSKQRVEQLAT